jgi:hypothetical protein
MSKKIARGGLINQARKLKKWTINGLYIIMTCLSKRLQNHLRICTTFAVYLSTPKTFDYSWRIP